MRQLFLIVFLSLPCALSAPAQAQTYRMDWHIALVAGDDYAKVALAIEDGRPVRRVRFRYDPARFRDFEAVGDLEVTEGGVGLWEPASEDASLSYRVKITRERDNKNQELSYDALMTDDWALFRGDRVTPRMRVTTRAGAVGETLLHFELPDGWDVNTGWPLHEEGGQGTYRVDDPNRRFDRPTGWIMAGDLGTRRDHLGDTYFSVVAPLGSEADRMGWLALARLVYPEMEQAFETMPAKILMVSADDPLWRGGLSGPNSFYFHSSRRAISENGTSPLLHELVHVITRIRGGRRDDWIAEGLAEYYGIELLYRAGGFSADRKEAILERLEEWGENAPELRVRNSTGPTTARAVVLFQALDEEIADLTDGRASLDAVTRRLMEKGRVSFADLVAAVEDVTGSVSTVLDTVNAQ